MMDGYDSAARETEFGLTLHYAASGAEYDSVDDGAARLATDIDARLDKLRRIKFKRRLVAVALVAGDMLACVMAVLLSQTIYGAPLDPAIAGTVLAAGFPVYFLAALQTGAHNPTIAHRPGASICSSALALAVTSAIFFAALFAAKLGAEISRLQVALTLAICVVLGATARYVISRRSMHYLGSKPFANLCIYDDVPMRSNRGPGAICAADAGLVPNLARPEMVSRLGALVRGMDRVVVHCSPGRREAWARALKCVDIRSEIVMPELTQMMPLDIRYRSGEVSLVLANGPLRWHQRLTKNLFDRVVSAVALVLCMPLLAAIAIAVKLDSPGPALFGQERIGLGNRRFKIWKFRTMRHDMQDSAAARLTAINDPRVTRLGAFLRRTSLDELPQILNVLMGHMSIVGPRPHALKALAGSSLYWEVSNDYWFRHALKPGITGLAQVRGHRGNTFHEDDLSKRLQADLEYVANWSLMTDVRIICQTTLVLVHRNAF